MSNDFARHCSARVIFHKIDCNYRARK